MDQYLHKPTQSIDKEKELVQTVRRANEAATARKAERIDKHASQ